MDLEPRLKVLQIREAFEVAWQDETPPSIAGFLRGLDQPVAEQVVGVLVVEDRDQRLERGLPWSLEDCLAELSVYESVIRKALVSDSTPNDADETGVMTPNFAAASEVSVQTGANQTGADAEGDVASRRSPNKTHPEQIGPYRLLCKLGEGAYGEVYSAVDQREGCQVAVKLARDHSHLDAAGARKFLEEAEVLAKLEHPHIVRFLDAGVDDAGRCYMVSQLIDGGSLDERLKTGPLPRNDAVRLLISVAEALHAAHRKAIVHRDVKPANILIDTAGIPYLADFGLALTDEQYGLGQSGQFAGSLPYMSPEQARGESHLVDGRTDIYALGVILYEMLTRRRPVQEKRLGDPGLTDAQRRALQVEFLRRICEVEIRPPRQLEDSVPLELERICLKSLAKRASDRYSTARDLADDLRVFLEQPAAEVSAVAVSAAVRIMPKGLRSFTADDADFFLDLLPGPRDRHGLPDNLRFWKSRLEETDADETFRVGLLYGPSGCGKSSLVKAGLLPRLSSDILPLYVEATANETETRLMHGLRKRCPSLPSDLSLQQMLSALRNDRGLSAGRKVLLVIDQFEQWLHAQHDAKHSPLVEALRQCDGGRVQCLVMVREDFWMAVTRFLRELEVSQVEGLNVASVDLFPESHARRTLTAFGRAFGTLGSETEPLSEAQAEFIQRCVAGLAEDGKVICVRLALFAEMVKGKPWTPETLTDVGGAQGIGVTFLEETFSSSSAPPEHRLHQNAARSILKSLLPLRGTDIKGHWRSREELLIASGYDNRPRDFDDVLRILDAELRLITPTDPEGRQLDGDDPDSSVDASGRYYQLTHDYLVPSLRDWLTRKQQETRRGRAVLWLAERSATWNAKPERRHLPSVFEYANVRLFTSKKNWTKPERRMMRKAGQSHGLRWGTGLVLMLALAVGFQLWNDAENHRHMVGRIQTAVANMGTSRGVLVPRDIDSLEDEDLERDVVLEELRSALAQAAEDDKLGLAYALAYFGDVDAEYLVGQIKMQSENESRNLINALRLAIDPAIKAISKEVEQADADEDWVSKARLATVALMLGESTIAAEMLQAFPKGSLPQPWDPIQRTTLIREFSSWCDAPEEIVASVRATKDLQFRSGMCLSLAEIENPTPAAKDAWHDTLSHWATNSPDSGTHSAARLTLTRWGLRVPEIETTKLPSSDRDWWHTPLGHRMVRIRPGVVTREHADSLALKLYPWLREKTGYNEPVEVKREFWLSDTEVTVAQYKQFMADVDYPVEKKPREAWEGAGDMHGLSESDQKSHPVELVNWYDAVMYCNWLSEKEGLEPCYSIVVDTTNGGSDIFADHRRSYVVTVRDSGTGYRLPTAAEWEYACRALTTTKFSYGESESRLVDYGCFERNSDGRTSSVGGYLPNGWGLFDIHGNVTEWCGDDPEMSDQFVLGGDYGTYGELCSSWSPTSQHPLDRKFTVGFRLAAVPSSQ